MHEYVGQGIDYQDPSDETGLAATGTNHGTVNHYVETVSGGNTVMDINGFADATLHGNFPRQDMLFDGSHMSFVDYFNSTW
jgi:hypothetical protein